MSQEYRLTRDPAFWAMGAFFALLTTAMPALFGQMRFMPISQTIVLSIFMGIAVRRHDLRSALTMVYTWLLVSMTSLIVLMLLVPGQVERAFDDGFMVRAMTSEWYFTNSPLPASFATEPIPAALEIAGVTLGALFTGGVIGVWSLVRMANLAAFTAGHLLGVLGSPLWIVVALPIWNLLQIVGAGGLVVIFAEPLLVDRFGLRRWFTRRRLALAIFGAIYVAGVLAKLILPAFWHFHN
ncbi:MAG: hypothetical protein KJZ95_00335 [Caldilinea sp.]|jgi:hypothetical protein|nr:hypothetical protein [Caldilinea sp.]